MLPAICARQSRNTAAATDSAVASAA
jgi:hypothetical protein